MKKSLLNILFWSIISAAFIGPGTVTTAAKSGADYGVSLLWALSFATIACFVLQEASARLTIASGMNLGQAIEGPSGTGQKWILVPILVASCILSGTAAYEIGNLLGAMAGLSLVLDVSPSLIVLAIGMCAALLLLIPSIKVIARILGSLVVVMGLAFVLTAIAIRPAIDELLVGLIRPVIPSGTGGSLLVLGLIGTTVVPYNLFLGSGISSGQNLKEMRSGLLAAILLGGLISMAVLITGTAVSGEFSFERLGVLLERYLGSGGRLILAGGLFAAGFTSAVTAPLASALTVKGLFGNRNPQQWQKVSWRFRLVWAAVLVMGTGYAMAGVQPIPAIILAQALNGLILPVIAVFIFWAVNSPTLMKQHSNGFLANVVTVFVVFIALLLGMTGLTRAAIGALDLGLTLDQAINPLIVLAVLGMIPVLVKAVRLK